MADVCWWHSSAAIQFGGCGAPRFRISTSDAGPAHRSVFRALALTVADASLS